MSGNPKQDQHTISKTYLRGFSFTEPNGKVSIYIRDKELIVPKITVTGIESFSTALNIFDLAFGDKVDIDALEKLFKKYEDNYPEIKTELKKNGFLSGESEALLFGYMSGLLIRTSNFRTLLIKLFNKHWNDLKNELLSRPEKHYEEYLKGCELFEGNDRINFLTILLIEFLGNNLRKEFNYVFLTTANQKGWLTGDNPVYYNPNTLKFSLLQPELEIIFPLNKEFCLYVWHSGHSRSEKVFDKLQRGKIYAVGENIHIDFYNKIQIAAKRYIIFPDDPEMQKLRRMKSIFDEP